MLRILLLFDPNAKIEHFRNFVNKLYLTKKQFTLFIIIFNAAVMILIIEYMPRACFLRHSTRLLYFLKKHKLELHKIATIRAISPLNERQKCRWPTYQWHDLNQKARSLSRKPKTCLSCSDFGNTALLSVIFMVKGNQKYKLLHFFIDKTIDERKRLPKLLSLTISN